jgi:hypothetical protein
MKSETTFISYSRADSDFVIKLAQDLRQAGVSVWLDQIDISPGERWDKSVQNALKNCSSLLVVYSPNSVASDNVMDEVYYVLGEKRKVIPILYRACEVPFRLQRLQYIDFTENHALGMKKLVPLMVNGINVPILAPTSKTSSNKESNPENTVTKNNNISKKNVAEDVDIEVEGNITIGDKRDDGKQYDQKNVVKKGKLKSKGDFNLGDS